MALVDSSIWAFVGVAAVVTMTPGPDTMLVVRNTLARGWRGGGFSVAGILTGGIVQASAAAGGLSAILLRSSELYSLVKFLGALYLVYLGVQSLRSGLSPKDEVWAETAEGGAPLWSFREGFLSNALNPKVAIFYVAFLPQFIRPMDPVLAKTFLLVGIHYSISLVWLLAVSFAVSRAATAFRGSRLKRNLDLAAGAIFIGLGARLALDRSAH